MPLDACLFPNFRARYLGSTQPYVPEHPNEADQSGEVPQSESSDSFGPQARFGRLDLRALAREDGEPTEVGARRSKLAAFEYKCSEIIDKLYISGEAVARDLQLLQKHRITHVINCVASLFPPFHEQTLTYKNLYLNDVPDENILCVMHDCFDFIDVARANGGRVLVHCAQGVSRSATVVIGYCMWKLGLPYDDVFDHVKNIRQVVSPNVGFQFELMQWQRRRLQGVKKCHITRLAPQSTFDPLYIVPKVVAGHHHNWYGLDSRGVFFIQTPGRLHVWIGSQVHPTLFCHAGEVANHICKYDSAHALAVEAVDEGDEGATLTDALRTEDDGPGTAAAVPKRRAEYDAELALLDEALAEQGNDPAEHYGEACRAANVWVGDASSRLGGRLMSHGGLTARSYGGMTARSHGGMTSRHRSDGDSDSIAPVVPPLQLNTFPISPPLSSRSRTPKT